MNKILNQTFIFCFAASHKRKGSSDDRCQDGGYQKKARVFFTEEQRDVLRVAYAADPYPSPSRIEELANQIGVGTKTIVNWFHNHYMQAKQQPSSAGSGNGSIKLEPEDTSNQSDAHSPASSSPAPGTGVRAGTPPGDGGSQWMFPTFEPVHMLRNHHEEYLSAMNDQQGQDLSVVKPEPPGDVTQTNGGVEELSPKPPTPDLIENMPNAEADQSNNSKPSKGNQEERKN